MAERFSGFIPPQENFYRLPNNWIETLKPLHIEYDGRIIAPLKTIEYVIKLTWGAGNYHRGIRLTAADIRHGKRRGKTRIDSGTGLSENAIRKALKQLVEFGYLEEPRPGVYLPKINISHSDLSVDEEGISKFTGFSSPRANFFMVPKKWTGICKDISSAPTILTVEYYFRHGWGYNNPNGTWMGVDEITNGRQYADGQRYDRGIDFDLVSVYRAVEEAVSRKLLVWTDRFRDETPRMMYNLYLEGMEIDPETGEYLGKLPWETEIEYQEWREAYEEERLDQHEICNLEESICNVESQDDCTNTKVVCSTGAPIYNHSNANCNPGKPICNLAPVVKDTLSNTPQTLSDTPPTTQAQEREILFLPLVDAVADDMDAFLQIAGIENPARAKILRSGISVKQIVAWMLYAWAQPTLSNPTGYLVSRLKAGDIPPQDFLEFATLRVETWIDLITQNNWHGNSGSLTGSMLQAWQRCYSGVQTEKCIPPVIHEYLVSLIEPEDIETNTESNQKTSIATTEPMEQFTQAWNTAWRSLKTVIPGHIFNNWLEGNELIRVENNVFTMGHHNPVAAEYMEPYIEQFEMLLEAEAGQPCRIIMQPF